MSIWANIEYLTWFMPSFPTWIYLQLLRGCSGWTFCFVFNLCNAIMRFGLHNSLFFGIKIRLQWFFFWLESKLKCVWRFSAAGFVNFFLGHRKGRCGFNLHLKRLVILIVFKATVQAVKTVKSWFQKRLKVKTTKNVFFFWNCTKCQISDGLVINRLSFSHSTVLECHGKHDNPQNRYKLWSMKTTKSHKTFTNKL